KVWTQLGGRCVQIGGPPHHPPGAAGRTVLRAGGTAKFGGPDGCHMNGFVPRSDAGRRSASTCDSGAMLLALLYRRAFCCSVLLASAWICLLVYSSLA